MVAPDDPGDELGRRLGAALADLRSTQVDAGGLLEGSTRRARQVRTRRLAAVGVAAALVVAVPFGYEVVSRPDESPPVAALVPTTHAPKPRPGWTATTIPDSFPGPVGSVLPGEGVSLVTDDPRPGQPVVDGLTCPPGSAAANPRAARSWVYDSGAANGASVTVTVTGWPGDRAERAFEQVTSAGSGPCRWRGGQPAGAGSSPLGDEAWNATSTDGDRSVGRTVVRRGPLIVGVRVTLAPRAADDPLPWAQHIAGQTVARLGS